MANARTVIWVLGLLALGKTFLHLLFIEEYGFFRDELYYLACSDRLAWGYVDQPPLSIFLLKAVRLLFGDALWVIRLPAVMAGAGTVFLVGLIARAMHGGPFAIFLAGLASVVAPIYLGMHKFFSMNAFDILFWSLSVWFVLGLLKENRLSRWALLGFVLGLGLLNKHSVLFFGFGLGIGLVGTRHRRLLLTPGPYLAGLIALVLFAPNLWWQFANEAPTLEFMTNARLHKNAAFAPADFLGGLVLEMHPLAAPLWLAGLAYLLLAQEAEQFRLFGIAFLGLLLLFLFTGGKTYYLAPAFPPLLAGGAVALERFHNRNPWPGLRSIVCALLLAGGIVTLPMALPVLPIRAYIAYQDRLGVGPPAHERHHTGSVPQHFADMFGWRELAAGVAGVHASLPAADRERAIILGRNYGYAGALEWFGREYGLPHVVSGHNNYYFWGYYDSSFDPVIAAGLSEEYLREVFRQVKPAGVVECEFCLPDRRRKPLFICRGLKVPAQEAWTRLKRFI